MHTVTKQLRTETGHRLTNYDGRCAHLHGHSYLWEVTIGAPHLDDKNMVADFKDLKRYMNKVLDPLDHCLVLAPDDPLVELCLTTLNPITDLLRATNGKEPRYMQWHDNPTAESFAQWCFESIQFEYDNKPGDINVLSVRVWETATSYAEYTGGD